MSLLGTGAAHVALLITMYDLTRSAAWVSGTLIGAVASRRLNVHREPLVFVLGLVGVAGGMALIGASPWFWPIVAISVVRGAVGLDGPAGGPGHPPAADARHDPQPGHRRQPRHVRLARSEPAFAKPTGPESLEEASHVPAS